MYDTAQQKGVNLGSTRIHTLGYADDLVLTDKGDTTGSATATARVTDVLAGSRKEADIKVKSK